jgi:hypothetical protein
VAALVVVWIHEQRYGVTVGRRGLADLPSARSRRSVRRLPYALTGCRSSTAGFARRHRVGGADGQTRHVDVAEACGRLNSLSERANEPA